MSSKTQNSNSFYEPVSKRKSTSLCNGKVYVRAYERGDSIVKAHTRLCPVHGEKAPYNEKLNLTGVHGPIMPQYQAMFLIAHDFLTPIADDIIDQANNGPKKGKTIKNVNADLYQLIEQLILMVPTFDGWQTPVSRDEPMLPDEVAEKTDALIEACAKDTIKQEGSYNYIYADTKCNQTVGVGHLVATEDEAAKLPLYREKDDGTYEPLSVYEKRAHFRQNQSTIEEHYTELRYNKKTNEFEPVCNTKADEQELLENLKIVMKEEDILALAKQDLKKAIKRVRNKVADHGVEFFDLPPSLQQVLTDMEFNMGGKFQLSEEPRTETRKSWPNLTHAMRQGSLSGMALNVDSSDVGLRRNIYRKALLARAQIEYWYSMISGTFQ